MGDGPCVVEWSTIRGGRWRGVALALTVMGCPTAKSDPATATASAPTAGPAATAPATADVPMTAGERRRQRGERAAPQRYTNERWRLMAASLDEAAPETADAVANGCTRSEMPAAVLHERTTLREGFVFALEFTDAVTRAEPRNGQWRNGITPVSGWKAAWLHLPGMAGLCVASFRYLLDGELKIASFYYRPGVPARAVPANAEADRMATLIDIHHDREAHPSPDLSDESERAETLVISRHNVAGELRDVLRGSSGMMDVYIDRDDSQVLVLRPGTPCAQSPALGALLSAPNVVQRLRESDVRRVECADAPGRSAERIGEDVPTAPVGRHHRHRR